MRIRVLGAGWYGCHTAITLMRAGHDVEIHESKDSIFAGASGAIPARLHLGFHYPRSQATREACQEHTKDFMAHYGHLTKLVPLNIYAIAKNDSLVDFGQYVKTMTGEVDFIRISEADAPVYGLQNIEGALLTGERHVIPSLARKYFESIIGDKVVYNSTPDLVDDPAYDWTIDCTFCANDSAGVDRYEPCIVGLLKGPTDKAITIMDGPFSSLYPWDEEKELNSLSSAKWSPLSKECRTWEQANEVIEMVPPSMIEEHLVGMMRDIATYFPQAATEYDIRNYRLSIRAMPRSGADSRLVEVAKVGKKAIRVRAGKIDAVIAAAKYIKEKIQ